MANDINPSRIVLRVRLSHPRLAVRDSALACCGQVADHLASENGLNALKALASQFSLVPAHPPLAAWLDAATKAGGRGLVVPSVEYVEGNDVALKMDLVDPNGLRAVLRAEAAADQEKIAGVWILRAFRWLLARLGGQAYAQQVTSDVDAHAAQERERQTHALMRLQILIAAATEVDRNFENLFPRIWIMCPDSVEPPMELPSHRLRANARETVPACVSM